MKFKPKLFFILVVITFFHICIYCIFYPYHASMRSTSNFGERRNFKQYVSIEGWWQKKNIVNRNVIVIKILQLVRCVMWATWNESNQLWTAPFNAMIMEAMVVEIMPTLKQTILLMVLIVMEQPKLGQARMSNSLT